MSSKKIAVIIIGAAAVVAAGIIYLPRGAPPAVPNQAAVQGRPGAAPAAGPVAANNASSAPARYRPVPLGDEIYSVADAAEVWPKFVQVEVDPPNVRVGDTQKLTAILQSQSQLVSVTAKIQTDNNLITVPLQFAGKASAAELLPVRYAVNAEHVLVAVNGNNESGIGTADGARVALAAELPKLKYTGTWVVRDTHEATYTTMFAAKDAAGDENSVTLAWSDPCGPPKGGDWTMTTSCTLTNTTDGADNGSSTISAGTLALSNSTFAWNPGTQITIKSGASITIDSTSKLTKSYLYAPADSDGDGYASGTGWLLSGTTRKYAFSGSIGDCNDSNANVKPGQTNYFTSATTTNMNLTSGLYDGGGEVNFDYNCDGTLTLEYSAVTNIVCSGCDQLCSGGSGNQAGWTGTPIPGCGSTGDYQLYCETDFTCNFGCSSFQNIYTATQGCH
jgi:hypothetical protein